MGIFDRIVGQLGELIDQTVGPDDVRLHVEQGESLLAAGDPDGAARELYRALSHNPNHARAGLLLGRAELLRGDAAAAERAIRAAIAARPDFPEAEVVLGEALAQLGDERGATEALRRGLDGGVSDPELRGAAWRGLGALHLAAGRADKAVRELRKAAASLAGDAEANRLLGEALSARGDLDGARVCLEKAVTALAPPGPAAPVPPGAPPEGSTSGEATPDASPSSGETPRQPAARRAHLARALCLLADVQRRLGRAADARAAWQRALSDDPRSVDALLGLAGLDAAEGRPESALAGAREALAIERSARTLLAVARGLRGSLAVDAAYELARAAATSRTDSAAIAAEALHAALRAVDGAGADEPAVVAAAARAARLVQGDAAAIGDGEARPDRDASGAERSDVLAANALEQLLGSPNAPPDLERAARLAAQAVSASDSLEAQLVHARVAAARGDRAAAAASLRRAVELSPAADDRARRRLAEVYRTGAPPLPPGDGDLYALLRALHARLQHTPELSDLAPAAARVVEVLDRPLLVTVMGEFNAGKSTFVNALVGEEVAPMGILPTTATINVLKYGAERGGRVVYRDDSVRPVAWAEVGPLLRALDEAEAARIRFVEVLYPLETLQRVNIVDTPGLNSIRPEHEATAREFIAQADAVIWLFSCRQAGTASEREALVKVRDAHKQALGVVNQIDRLAGDAQVDEVLAHIESGFRDLVVALVPFSAREALVGRDDPARLERSRRALLERTLDEHFFNRAKSIQRVQAARRARALVDEATQRAAAAAASPRREAIDAARRAVSTARQRFARFLDQERLALIADLDNVYAQAAREVLDFARPRSWPFGANQAAPADRDFLVDLVEERLGDLTEASRARVARETERASADSLSPLLPRAAALVGADELRLLDEQVYGRYRAFIRGFLRGGRVDDFFTRVLPRLELGEHAIRRALMRDLPALDVLDEELLGPLGSFAERSFARLGAALDREASDEDLRRLEVEERLLSPIAQLGAALSLFPVDESAELGDAPGGAASVP